MRRIALLGWVLSAAGAQARFAPAQTQAVPPGNGTGGGTNAPSGVIVESASPSVVQKPIGPVRISGAVLKGYRISYVPPVYPADAESARLEGQVFLHVVISTSGTVQKVQVLNSTNPIFNQASIDSVRQWRYRPYLLNGQPTEVDSIINLNFQARPSAKPQQ